MANSLGKIVGGVLLLGGTAAVWFWPDAGSPEVSPEPLRPVRSIVIGDSKALPDFSFSGLVKAGDDRKLVFKQAGRIQRIVVKKAQHVKKGEKIAWLIPDDFQNRLADAEAAAKRDRLTFERVKVAAEKNAVSQEELSKAEANLKRSEAQYQLAKTAMDETVLTAPFDSVIADVPPSELDMVGPGDVIAYVLDLSRIKVDVSVPETFVIMQRQFEWKEDAKLYVTFDSAGDRKFAAEFVEWKSMAEKNNQTFTATYVLSAPEDLLLLPGMSATVIIPGSAYSLKGVSDRSVAVPESAVGVDADGTYYAWKLLPVEGRDGVFSATKCRLADPNRVKDVGALWVEGDIRPGDRIATAGVSVLTEGRLVTLLERPAR